MASTHILTLAQTMAGGGVERALLRLCGGWIERGRRVTLLRGSTDGPLDRELPPGIELIDLGNASYTALLRAAPGAVRAVAPDVLFCPGNHYSAIAASVRLRLGRQCPPIVGKVSNALVRRDMGLLLAPAYATWLRLHPRFLDAAVAMTPAMREEAMAMMRMPPDRITVIPNPPARSRVTDATIPLPDGRYILGVGRLAPQKRWERLIAALPRLPDDVCLLLLGDGSERGALEAQVAALGLQHRVAMPGYAADPLPAIARASMVVLTSDFEGVPGVLREAASVGTPIVATESSVAVREIVGPGMGTVVPVGDAAALVAAITAWLAPEAVRPPPLPETGDPVGAYIALFDTLS